MDGKVYYMEKIEDGLENSEVGWRVESNGSTEGGMDGGRERGRNGRMWRWRVERRI